MVLAVGILVGEAAALADPSSSWARGSGGVSTWDNIWIAALGLLGIWLGIRLLRLGVLQISTGKMTVRGYLHTLGDADRHGGRGRLGGAGARARRDRDSSSDTTCGLACAAMPLSLPEVSAQSP